MIEATCTISFAIFQSGFYRIWYIGLYPITDLPRALIPLLIAYASLSSMRYPTSALELSRAFSDKIDSSNNSIKYSIKL